MFGENWCDSPTSSPGPWRFYPCPPCSFFISRERQNNEDDEKTCKIRTAPRIHNQASNNSRFWACGYESASGSCTSAFYSPEQHTFSFKTRNTNIIIFSFSAMSNSTDTQSSIFSADKSNESRLSIWVGFAWEANDTPKQPGGSENGKGLVLSRKVGKLAYALAFRAKSKINSLPSKGKEIHERFFFAELLKSCYH